MRIQVITTQRCNAICDYCDKAVGLAKLTDMELTAAQMRVAVQQSIDTGMRITQVTLSGGEPVLNTELQGIIYACLGLPDLLKVRVLTNDMPITLAKRDTIELPDERFRWTKAPLDDPMDYKSGKNKPGVRYRDRVHVPFWVSPADIGAEANWANCTIKNHCGRGLDSSGWSMCGQAGILGRVLGINPYDPNKPANEQVNTPVEEICRHCQYGMVVKGKAKKKIAAAVAAGEMEPISKTFVDAFAQFEREPVTYDIALGV